RARAVLGRDHGAREARPRRGRAVRDDDDARRRERAREVRLRAADPLPDAIPAASSAERSRHRGRELSAQHPRGLKGETPRKRFLLPARSPASPTLGPSVGAAGPAAESARAAPGAARARTRAARTRTATARTGARAATAAAARTGGRRARSRIPAGGQERLGLDDGAQLAEVPALVGRRPGAVVVLRAARGLRERELL